MTAHTKGTTAVMNPSVPATPESPGRKTNIPDKSSPKQKQKVEGISSSKAQAVDEKQQQQRAPERVATESASVSSNTSTTTSSSKTATTSSGDGNGDIIGEYVLGETIGKGTFGKVKLGLHLLTGEKVAVKILEKKRIVLAADVERVAREIKILKRNRHQNVIQLYEVIDSPDRIFLIMEHVDGGEMFEYIVSHHRIRETEAAFLFRQIVDGLAYLHSNEVTHRDLKPENLLLQSSHLHSTRQQQEDQPNAALLVKIVDFGLSNTHDGGRLLRTACGSPCYAAPEMIQGRLYRGPIADMWSLGVVLFAMVCGFLPFEDSNTNLLYKKILSANYKMPTFLSANVQDLIRHILETDPDKRYNVDKIRQHPWLAGVQTPDLPGYDVDGDATIEEIKQRRELVLGQLDSLGLSKDEVQLALSKKSFNRFTASYYLLDNKLQRIMRSRVIATFAKGNNRPLRREKNTNSDDKRQEPAVRPGGSLPESGRTASGKNTDIPRHQNSSSRGVEESPRSRANSQHQQQYADDQHDRRAATPVHPRHNSHYRDASVPTQRPSSVRGGRHLVMLNNGPAVTAGSAFWPIAPNPPREHRHSGLLTARKQSNTRVTVSNGMVALRPLAQSVHPPKRELLSIAPQPATRRHSTEVHQHAPHFRTVHDLTLNPATEPTSHYSVTAANGGVAIRRRPQAAPHPPHTAHLPSPQPSVTTAPPHGSSVAKSDDTRAPQRPEPHPPANL
ncbi:5'-AMP-activated protein kinase, catalytic subunit [Phytophthora megakarya]|uniref:5'-AMP-activated protein kinase, catalytic subunit n=1 Tax=Phytophthora megakarya TaxID=4795 RepID=A0A225WVW5_9STRA|nr:5'-AMP-activated protein kinase, catalytic subunit [Phytophthora megakarya]